MYDKSLLRWMSIMSYVASFKNLKTVVYYQALMNLLSESPSLDKLLQISQPRLYH